MSVGNKIKALRLKRGMTQSTLAEGIITRGMLSRIESGSASPSMASLSALAERLDVSPSFLLEEGDDLLPAERAYFAKKLNTAFKAGNLRECLALFATSPFSEEEEFIGLYIHAAFSVATEEFCNGHFAAAEELLSITEYMLPKSLLRFPDASAERIAFMRTVMAHIDDPDTAIRLTSDTPDFSFQPALFFFILKLLQNGRQKDCAFLIEFGIPDPMYRTYIEAQMFIREYKFVDAILTMKGLVSKKECPCFLTLLCYRSMENCCKLCEDYKGAYENHLAYQALLEKLKTS